jgi:hypothetical protein
MVAEYRVFERRTNAMGVFGAVGLRVRAVAVEGLRYGQKPEVD